MRLHFRHPFASTGGQEPRPRGHHLSALLDHVAALVGPLDGAAAVVREGDLGHVALEFGALGRPVAERAAQAVRHRRAPGPRVGVAARACLVDPLHAGAQRHVRQHPAARGREHEVAARWCQQSVLVRTLF